MYSSKSEFLFGSTYCPYAKSGDLDMEYWEQDIIKMKELNFNIIRSFVAWDRIETMEGILNFEKLDHIFYLAEKHKMKILLNLNTFNVYGGIYHPPWLKHYNCQPIVSDPCHEQKQFGPVFKICMDDPVFTMKADGFLIKVIQRYSPKDALIGWNLYNEPFMFDACYCTHTLALFRIWLKKKYDNDLQRLNAEWSTEFSLNYEKWEDVEPTPDIVTPFIGASNACKLDWFRFNEENLADKIKHTHCLVKENDLRQRPTTLNIAYLNANSNYGHHKFCDIWKINPILDIPGYSHYTLNNEEHAYERASRLARIRSSSASPRHEFMVIETEADPRKSLALRENSFWQIAAHGSKSIMIWKYRGRVTDNQTDNFNLTGWDGSITQRASLAGKVSGQLSRISSIINDKYFNAEVAILTSSESMNLSIISYKYDLWKDSWTGAYKMLWDLNIPANYVSYDHILSGEFKKYKALFLPFAMNLNFNIAAAIMEYVKAGGIVIADYCVGIYNDKGTINLKSPGFGLDDLFGCFYNDKLQVEKDEIIQLNDISSGISVNTHEGKHYLYPRDCAKVIGTFSDGNAAAVLNKFGRGYAIIFGTCFFAEYKNNPQSAGNEIVRELLKLSHVESNFTIYSSESGVTEKSIEICELKDDDGGKIFFVINHNEADKQLDISIKNNDATTFFELLSREQVKVKDNSFSVQLKTLETKIYSNKNSNK